VSRDLILGVYTYISQVPFAVAAFVLIPHTTGNNADVESNREKIKRFDIPGTVIMLVAIILLILGLTLGATYGFQTTKFLVPFLLSWPVFVLFFFWEASTASGVCPRTREFLVPSKYSSSHVSRVGYLFDLQFPTPRLPAAMASGK
jgi:hypothetical protein